MTLSLEVSHQIIADVIGRHERQIAELKVLLRAANLDPEDCFRKLIKLEADLQDMRQGLYAAAYVAISCVSETTDSHDSQSSTSKSAISARAKKHFREG